MDDFTGAGIAALAASLGLGGIVVAVINGFVQRRKIGADATVVVIAAARELVDPLRKELRSEREGRSEDMQRQAALVRTLREELEQAYDVAHRLREEVGRLQQEVVDLKENIGMLRGRRTDYQ